MREGSGERGKKGPKVWPSSVGRPVPAVVSLGQQIARRFELQPEFPVGVVVLLQFALVPLDRLLELLDVLLPPRLVALPVDLPEQRQGRLLVLVVELLG
jgi:hypothetical protein